MEDHGREIYPRDPIGGGRLKMDSPHMGGAEAYANQMVNQGQVPNPRPPSVQVGFSRAESDLGEIISIAQELEKRLTPILRPNTPEPSTANQTEPSAVCQMDEKLQQIHQGMRMAYAILQSINRRLEL